MGDNMGCEGGFALDVRDSGSAAKKVEDCCFSLPFFQKLIVENLGTYFLIFAGCRCVSSPGADPSSSATN